MNPLANMFDALEPKNVKAADLPGVQALRNEILPKVKELTCAHKKDREDFDFLAEVRRVRAAELAEDKVTLYERIKAAIREAVDNQACDLDSVSQGLTAPERKVQLQQDVLDALDHILIPAAQDKMQESFRDLKRLEHLEAAVYCAESHATLLEKLEGAGISQGHGRVVAFSETIERLKAIAEEAHRQAQLADAELTAARAARLTRQQQRQAGGLITQAEAIFTALELSRSNNTEGTK